ncbi:Glycolipid 2-alpha-mannosyltransferase [Seminavis robusta]|uniref:Glycolipid 2-alpha-mannosyltransferase n=1 Tax=Seminavis robusta TaxID=568900 RepID=A0A9N8EME9_9STRA|nr:Glycolipid 2-alpha-mannosyltransferase [Seminavis robusta]|eukprot:Sro1210_g252750.1 Glycolipid 2-alpha-mannosyltransferase (1288) ;mRNA; f:13324-17187
MNLEDTPRPTLHRKRRCSGCYRCCCRCCCSSSSFFYCVGICVLVFVAVNLLAGQAEYSIEREERIRHTAAWTIPSVPEHDPLNDKHDDPTVLQVNQDTYRSLNVVNGIRPTHQACDGYNGILLISQGDIGGAAGTIFFQFVIGQILYAERNNLKPWVYINNISYVIYDPVVHGAGPGVSFRAMDGMNASHILRPNGIWRDRIPGPPVKVGPYVQKEFRLEGTGVWQHYFEPISDFIPGDKSCEDKPVVQMDLFLITPGIHGFAEWAPRCWRYSYAPDYMTLPHIPLHEWLEPQRIIANNVVQKYIHFRPDILQAAQQANPWCSLSNPCLGLHVRQSDKAAGRRQIQTDEFLPYAIAFIKAGGNFMYLATDSTKVLNEVNTQWPAYVRERIRTIGDNVIRSSDEQAVFDIGDSSHDRTNREILIEIVALANCQFMVHGLSAVTESSIWINVDLHDTSVNLEDPEAVSPVVFSTLVQMVLRGEPRGHWPTRQKQHHWWNHPTPPTLSQGEPTHQACDGYKGVLLISRVGPKDTTGMAFFNSILNQLLYAEMQNLKPWIHLGRDSAVIYDEQVHGGGPGLALEFLDGYIISTEHDKMNVSAIYPGIPVEGGEVSIQTLEVTGNGVWNSYFQPVSKDMRPGDQSCRKVPLLTMEPSMISPGLDVWCPWCVRSWRYDGVPAHLWKPSHLKLNEWHESMRHKGHKLVQKYFQFLPHLERRSNHVNPTKDVNNTVVPCLAVHFRNSLKGGRHRKLVKAKEFQPYMDAFQRAGGKAIFMATDSHRVMELMTNGEEIPTRLQAMIRSQGRYVVRSSGGKKNKWPPHELADHHRTNSEVLLDILAMSKCHLFLHGSSTTSEAVFYLNPGLHNNSVNIEDPDRLSPDGFERLARQVIVDLKAKQSTTVLTVPWGPVTSNLIKSRFANTTVQTRDPSRLCKRNAIIYLAQKQHSTYGRDSYSILMQSLKLMFKNYLSLGRHRENTDLFIFHTGDFNGTDLLDIESQFGPEYYGIVRLVDLSGSKYWQRPVWHLNDNPNKNWYAYPLFSEGYRHMMRWYAIGLWDFFERYNQETGCSYRYLFRLDEDSYLHSPIRYDMFDFMKRNSYVYGYRMCAYEMKVTQRIQKRFRQKRASFRPVREVDLEMCGFYNNLFVADIEHFRSPPVQDFLRIVDREGLIYRRRLGDLMIHSLSVYFFAPAERIHRFLDFTYQHATENQTSGCVVWGGIEAGYDDQNAETTLNEYYQRKIVDLNCPSNATFLSEADLSPTYAHVPADLKRRLFLHNIMAGNVERPGKGPLSG